MEYWVGPLWVVVMAVEGETVRFATKSKYEITENSLAGVTAVIGGSMIMRWYAKHLSKPDKRIIGLDRASALVRKTGKEIS